MTDSCRGNTKVSLLLMAEPVQLAMTLSMHFLCMAALHSAGDQSSLTQVVGGGGGGGERGGGGGGERGKEERGGGGRREGGGGGGG